MAAEAVPIYLDESTIIHNLPRTEPEIADYLLAGVISGRYTLPGGFPERFTMGTSITPGERVMRLSLTGQTSNASGTNQERNLSLKRRFAIVNQLDIDKINLSPYTLYCTLEALANSIRRYPYELDIETFKTMDQVRRKTAFFSQFSDEEAVRYAAISADTALTILGLRASKAIIKKDVVNRQYGLNIVANRLDWMLKQSLELTRPDLTSLALMHIVRAWSYLQYLAINSFGTVLEKPEFFENVTKAIIDYTNALNITEILFNLSQSDIYLDEATHSPIFKFHTVVAILDNLKNSELIDKDAVIDKIRALISQRLKQAERNGYNSKFYEFDIKDAYLFGLCKKLEIELPPILRRIIEMAPQTSTEV